MATKVKPMSVVIGGFELTTGELPPPVVRGSKYDAMVDWIIEKNTWVKVTPTGEKPTLNSARQQLTQRGEGRIAASIRGVELWAAPVEIAALEGPPEEDSE